MNIHEEIKRQERAKSQGALQELGGSLGNIGTNVTGNSILTFRLTLSSACACMGNSAVGPDTERGEKKSVHERPASRRPR